MHHLVGLIDPDGIYLSKSHELGQGTEYRLYRALSLALHVPTLFAVHTLDIPLVFFASLVDLTVADYMFAIAATVFCLASIVCWYYMFRAVTRIHGPVYAVGHVMISVVLTPVVLTGIILIPLLVRGDAKRLSSSLHDSSGNPT